MTKENANTKKIHNPKSYSPAVYIPCWLSQVHKKLLTCGAKLVYGRLAQWSNSSGDVFRSSPQLSKELGIPTRNVERHIKELKDVGLIGTFQPQAGGVNHFIFYEHDWMFLPICEELSFQYPPPKMAVPPAKNGGTPPPKMAGINKKEIKESKCVADAPKKSTHTEASPFIYLTQNPECLQIFNDKFFKYEVTIEELFESCKNHYFPKEICVLTFKSWIRRERTDHFALKYKITPNPRLTGDISEQDRETAGLYRQARDLDLIEKWFPDKEKREQARLIFERVCK